MYESFIDNLTVIYTIRDSYDCNARQSKVPSLQHSIGYEKRENNCTIYFHVLALINASLVASFTAASGFAKGDDLPPTKTSALISLSKATTLLAVDAGYE